MKKIMSALLLAHSFSKVQNFDNLVIDSYQGCHIKSNLNQYLANINLFKQHISEVITNGKKNNYKAIWIELQPNELILAQVLVNYQQKYLTQQGFKMHRVTNNTLQFSKWLLESENKLPGQATHFLGVGGIIVKDGCVLLVQEKNGTRKGAWGTPGGSVDPKESLIDAVLREVKEETKLECKVDDILYFREMHQARYGKTDIYFAFKLSCRNTEQIKICDFELMDYRWVPVNDLLTFLKLQNQKPHIINFYKSIQERLFAEGTSQYLNIEEKQELRDDKMRYSAIYKPKF